MMSVLTTPQVEDAWKYSVIFHIFIKWKTRTTKVAKMEVVCGSSNVVSKKENS